MTVPAHADAGAGTVSFQALSATQMVSATQPVSATGR